MARVKGITHFHLPPTCLFTNGISLSLLPSHRASPQFGRYSLTVQLRVGGWVGLGGCLHTEVVCPSKNGGYPPSTNRARRRVTSLIHPTPLLLRPIAEITDNLNWRLLIVPVFRTAMCDVWDGVSDIYPGLFPSQTFPLTQTLNLTLTLTLTLILILRTNPNPTDPTLTLTLLTHS